MKKMILGVIAIVLCGVLLNAQDKHEYNKAIERCDGANNIIEHYTQQGDRYFSCKIEK